MLAHIIRGKYKWFFKNYQKYQSAKPFIAVYTLICFDKNVYNVTFFLKKKKKKSYSLILAEIKALLFSNSAILPFRDNFIQ